MRKQFLGICSAAVTIGLFVGLIAAPVKAHAFMDYSFGDGSEANPFRIRTCEEFASTMGPGVSVVGNFLIVNNLDCTAVDFTTGPTLLTGSIDGAGHTITNLTLGTYGLFYVIQNGTVKDLKLEGVMGDTFSSPMGSLAKQIVNVDLINVHSTVSMPDVGDGSGGLVGNAQDSTITNSSYIGTMTSNFGGGLVGEAMNVTITDSFTDGTIEGVNTGGMIGANADSVTLTNVVSVMEATGANAGGIVGPASIDASVDYGIYVGNGPLATGSNIISSSSLNAIVAHSYISGDNPQLIGDDYVNPTVSNSTMENGPYSDVNVLTSWGGVIDKPLWRQDAVNTPPVLSAAMDFELPSGAPNNGDSNGDSVDDGYQYNVMPILIGGNESWVTVEIPDDLGCSLFDVDGEWIDANYIKNDTGFARVTDYMVSFKVYCTNAGTTVPVTLVYDQLYDTTDAVIRQYDPNANSYIAVADAEFGARVVGATTVTTATYAITDGGANDIDGVLDNVITDPVGIAVAAAPVVTTPTTSQGASPAASTTSGSLADTGQHGMYLPIVFAGVLILSALALAVVVRKPI